MVLPGQGYRLLAVGCLPDELQVRREGNLQPQAAADDGLPGPTPTQRLWPGSR